MLCWALPASRSLRSTGRAEPLPLGAAGGPGRCHPLLSLWGSGCRARGLPGNAPALPSSPHGCPRFPGMAGVRSHCLGSSFPQSLCPGVLRGGEQRRGMTHPALPGLRECGRGALALCSPWHRQTPGHRHRWLDGGAQLCPAGDPAGAGEGGISCSPSSSLPWLCLCHLDLPGWFPRACLGVLPSPCGAGAHRGQLPLSASPELGARGCLGLGAGVTRGQASERGGNAAFSESSAFLRSSWETLAPSLRAPSPVQCS